jgi:hypothetical protein
MPESSSRTLRIFLCHASNDKPPVRDLYRRLKADGFAPWLDEEDLLPGQTWRNEISRAVRISDVVLVCLSQQSVNKTGYVQKEIKFALDVADEQPEGAIFLIPLRLEQCEVPDRLSHLQWVNLYEEGGYAHLLRSLRQRAEGLGMSHAATTSVNSSTQQPTKDASPPNATTVSGGADLNAQGNIDVGGDVIGRDKIVQINNYTQNAPIRPDVSSRTASTEWHERLDVFGLKDEDSDAFGKNEFIADLAYGSFLEPFAQAAHFAILAAVPTDPIDGSPAAVLTTAQKMLDLTQWYNPQANSDHTLPRYWPPAIFDMSSTTRRAGKKSLVWEHKFPTGLTPSQTMPEKRQQQVVLSRLVVTDSACVAFASSIRFLYQLKNGIAVFQIGRILAECWMFAGLVAQLQSNLGYTGQTGLCIGMVNTNGSHLGKFADRWLEPDEPSYWRDMALAGNDFSCHSDNLKFCERVDLLNMKPKEQPDFIRRFGEAISLAYNHDTPRCFEKQSGLVPKHYFDRY